MLCSDWYMPVKVPLKPRDDAKVHLQRARQFISQSLVRNEEPRFPATYEKMYNSCYYVVSVAGQGQTLYDHLTMELEKCTVGIRTELCKKPDDIFQWLNLFAEICSWYEGRIVRTLLSLCYHSTMLIYCLATAGHDQICPDLAEPGLHPQAGYRRA
jgi:hypothetical protein